MPSKVQAHLMRIPDGLWQQFGERAANERTTRAKLLRHWIANYVLKHDLQTGPGEMGLPIEWR